MKIISCLSSLDSRAKQKNNSEFSFRKFVKHLPDFKALSPINQLSSRILKQYPFIFQRTVFKVNNLSIFFVNTYFSTIFYSYFGNYYCSSKEFTNNSLTIIINNRKLETRSGINQRFITSSNAKLKYKDSKINNPYIKNILTFKELKNILTKYLKIRFFLCKLAVIFILFLLRNTKYIDSQKSNNLCNFINQNFSFGLE
ncbi:hypothetical protein ACFFRR_005428 [Megaselia abdita]